MTQEPVIEFLTKLLAIPPRERDVWALTVIMKWPVDKVAAWKALDDVRVTQIVIEVNRRLGLEDQFLLIES